ncbi:hypothetical protein, partial [Plasmodium yoelii yoelii]
YRCILESRSCRQLFQMNLIIIYTMIYNNIILLGY